jgi:hypothetical protein
MHGNYLDDGLHYHRGKFCGTFYVPGTLETKPLGKLSALGIRLKKTIFWSRKFYRRAIQLFGSHFYLNPDRDMRRSILVAGTARSGTTWLADLIASQIRCRIMFEPFNPELVSEYRRFHYFHYMHPDWENEELNTFARSVFTGVIRNRWIDRQNENIFPKYRLIKEIRANLLLKWLHIHFSEVPTIFLIRHPCAVVLSRMQLDWATDRDIEPFLSQPDLVADHLSDHLDLIRSAKTDEEKHAIIWCVSNLIPLRQFMPGELKIVYYEYLCVQPEIEFPAIFDSIGHGYSHSLVEMLNQPSQTTKVTSAVVTGSNKISHWKSSLSPVQIDRILKVVQAFGLDHLYDDSLLPLNLRMRNHVVA